MIKPKIYIYILNQTYNATHKWFDFCMNDNLSEIYCSATHKNFWCTVRNVPKAQFTEL